MVMKVLTGKVAVRVHGSSANLGPGYDVFAVALESFTDAVEAWIEEDGRGVVVAGVEGPFAEGIPYDANTARRAAELVAERAGFMRGIVLRIHKGVPPGKGLGSSGASASAAAIATSVLLGCNMTIRELVEISGLAESLVAGGPHYDNSAASILGGFVIVSRVDGEMAVERINRSALFILGVPQVDTPREKTRVMRGEVPHTIPVNVAVRQWGRTALMVHALHKGDLELLGRLMMSDEVVEPARSKHVPCYNVVRRVAVDSGALGVSLSGAGPSILILVGPGGSYDSASAVRRSVEEAYSECGVEAKIYTSLVGGGYRLYVSD